MIDFTALPFEAVIGQGTPEAVVTVDGGFVRLQGNTWQVCQIPQSIIVETVLDFDFESPVQGEIQGIGLATGLSPEEGHSFQLYGWQSWGHLDFKTYASGVTHFTIPVGEFFVGDFTYLVFINDHDVANSTAEVVFSNVEFSQPGFVPDFEDTLIQIRDLAIQAVGP